MFAIDSVSLCPYTGLLGITGSKRGFKGPLCFGWDVSTFHFPLFCFSCITFSRPMSCRCESLKVPILPLYSHEHVGDRVLWVDISKTLTWQMWIVLEQSHWKKQIHPVGCRPNFFFIFLPQWLILLCIAGVMLHWTFEVHIKGKRSHLLLLEPQRKSLCADREYEAWRQIDVCWRMSFVCGT